MMDWLAQIEAVAEALGPIGILIVSFLGNAIPYSTIPYLILVINYAALAGGNPWVLLAASVLGGLGAALGKLVVYSVGRVARVALSDESKENLELFTRIAGRSMFIAVFLFAALPLPDDILYVPLGVTGYGVFKFFTAVTLGKILITGAAVAIGRIIKVYAEEYTGLGNPLLSAAIAIAVSIVATYVILAIDWSSVVSEVERRGWVGFLTNAVKDPKRYLRRR